MKTNYLNVEYPDNPDDSHCLENKPPQKERRLLKYLRGSGVVLFSMLVSIFSLSQNSFGQNVTTDKNDYSSGDIVKITGSDWQAGETVMMVLVEDSVIHANDTLYSNADNAGGFFNNQFIISPADQNNAFTLTVTGLTSGLAYQVYFTVGKDHMIPMPRCDLTGPCIVCAGPTYTYSVSAMAGETYNWSLSPANGAMIVGSATNNTVTVSTSSSTGNFTLMIAITKDGVKCECEVYVKVNPSPACSINEPLNADGLPGITCNFPGGMPHNTISTSIVAFGNTYSWQFVNNPPAGWAITGGQGTNQIMFTSGLCKVGGVEIELTITTKYGCISKCTKIIDASAFQAPCDADAGVSCALDCNVSKIVLHGFSSVVEDSVLPASILWKGPGIVSGGNTLNPTVNKVGTYTLMITVFPGNSTAQVICSDTVTVNQGIKNPICLINDPLNPDGLPGITCGFPGGIANNSISASVMSAANTYLWQFIGAPAGWSITSGQGTGTIKFKSGTCKVGGVTIQLTVTDKKTKCYSKCTKIIEGTPFETPCDVNAGADGKLDCKLTKIVLNGSSTVVSDGVLPTSILWTGPGIVSGGTTFTPTVNAPGMYVLAITVFPNDALAKTVCKDTVIITQDTEKPVISEQHINVKCNKDCNGSIDVTVSGGKAPFTYMWNNGATTEDRTGLCAGNYTVTVTGANGCYATKVICITEPQYLKIKESHTNVKCYGGKDGSIDITVAGGTQPYMFMWSNGATTEDIAGLTVGTYTVAITDANGCMKDLVICITQPEKTTCSINEALNPDGLPGITCGFPGGTPNNKVSTSNVAVGNTYVWSFNAPSWIITGGQGTSQITFTSGACVPGGVVVSLTITDKNGCISICTDTIVGTPFETPCDVNAGADKLLNCITTQVSLNGTSTVVSDGVLPTSVLWTGPGIVSGATTLTVTVNAAGTYVLSVTVFPNDSLSQAICRDTVLVTQDTTTLLVSEQHVNVKCNKDCNGSIDITVNGAGSLKYLWNNGATTEDRTGLCAGTYTVTVTGANGCKATKVICITQPDYLKINEYHSNIKCCGDKTGSIDLTVTGGTMPYMFMWSNGATTEDISGLSAGTYTVVVTDVNGCKQQTAICITEPACLKIKESHTNVKCYGGKDGAIDITVTGGTKPYMFMWSNGATTEDISGLSAGTYTVTVTDNNGCVKQLVICITELEKTTCSINEALNPDGLPGITCGFPGGTPNNKVSTSNVAVGNTYVWSFNAPSWIITGGQGTSQITFTSGACVPGGVVVSLTITDKNGCISICTDTIVGTPFETPCDVNAGADKVLNCITTQVSLNGTSTVVSDGVLPTSVLWTGPGIVSGATTLTVTVNAAGTYVLSVTVFPNDSLSQAICRDTVLVTQDTAKAVISEQHVNVKCNKDCNGSIDITVNGAGSLKYLWNNGATTEDRTGLCAGTYTVTVTGANGCKATKVICITQPDYLKINEYHSNIKCCGDKTGSIDLTVTGGTMPYMFMWSNGATTEDISGLSAGTYTVVVTDVNGCKQQTAICITEPACLKIKESHTNVKCYGGKDGAIDITVAGGTKPYMFMWSNGATTEDISGLSAGTYTVTVTDNNGCVKQLVICITQLEKTTCSINEALNPDGLPGITCGFPGGTPNNKVSTSNVAVGNTYVWSFNAPSWIITGGQGTSQITFTSGACVPGGVVVSLTITDKNGCISICTDTIVGTPFETPCDVNAGADKLLNCITTQVSLNGTSTVVSDGVLPTSVLWTGPGIVSGATTLTVTVNAAGTYVLSVTVFPNDSLSQAICRDTVLVTQDTTTLLVSEQHVNVKCNKDCNGSIDITVNGAGSLKYLWNNGATTEDRTGLCAGTYTVTVTGANGCKATKVICITQPDYLKINEYHSNIKCCGDKTGSIDLTVTGGTMPYMFMWSNGATTEDISGLSAGTYTVVVTDVNGCKQQTAICITEPACLKIKESHTNVKCYGGKDGAIDITVAGGTKPYMFMWSNGATTEDISGLSAGTYTVTVTDNNGCVKQLVICITELEKTTCSINEALNPDGLPGITCGFPGGTPNNKVSTSNVAVGNTYVWSFNAPSWIITGGQGTSQITFTSGACVPGGVVVSLTITDKNGCISICTDTIVGTPFETPCDVNAGADKLLNCITTQVSLNGTSTVVSDGVLPTSVLWTGPGIVSGATTLTVTVNAAGTYVLSVTVFPNDSLSQAICRDTVLVTQDTAKAVISEQHVNVKCNKDCNGSIDITVNGAGSLKYLWNNGATTEDRTGLCAGTYTVTVTGANGCKATKVISITQPEVIKISETHVNVKCCGDKNGSINITTIGGMMPYIYKWSNGSTTEDISGLAAGTYTVVVTDANGCKEKLAICITEPKCILIKENHKNVSCNGDKNGSINITVTGGTMPYNYQWSNGATTKDISSVLAGTYTVVVTDASGCVKQLVICITQPLSVNIKECHKDVNCNGNKNGNIDITVTGGAKPYKFKWSNGKVTEDITGLCAGTYTVVVTDYNHCCKQLEICIKEPICISINENHKNVSCNGTCDGSIDITANGGTKPYKYKWSNGATTEDVSGLCAATYTVVVTDANGCYKQLTTCITQSEKIVITEKHVNVDCGQNALGSIDITVNGGTKPYVYMWSNASTTEDIIGLTGGTYTVVVTDANGCKASLSITLVVKPSPVCSINDELNPDGLPGITCNFPGGVSNNTISTSNVAVGNTYVWQFVSAPAGWSITAGQGTSQITFTSGSCQVGGVTIQLTITNQYGCKSTCTKIIEATSFETPCDVNAGADRQLSCQVTQLVLKGSSTVVSDSILPTSINWTGPGIVSGVNTFTPTVNAPGMYVLAITVFPGDPLAETICRDTVMVSQITELPNCSFTGKAPTCKHLTNVYTGPVSHTEATYSYNWTVTGGASISGSNNTSKVTVVAVKCNSSYTLCLEVTNNETGCKSKCCQSYSFKDAKAPVICKLPPPCVIHSPGTPKFCKASAKDECDPNPKLTYVDVKKHGSCGKGYTITRIWTAKDECGNTSTACQIVKVEDHTPPVICKLPDSCTFRCPHKPTFYKATCKDESDDHPSLTFVDVKKKGVCKSKDTSCTDEYIITRTWTAKDACGNISKKCQTIKVCPLQECENHSKSLDELEATSSNNMVGTNNDIIVKSYPNPFVSTATIEFTSHTDENVSVDIYTIDGIFVTNLFNQNVKSDIVNKVLFNGGDLSNGIYMYRISSGKNMYEDKLVLSK